MRFIGILRALDIDADNARTNVREMGSIVKEERRNYSIADFGTLKVTFGNALN